MEWHYTAKVDLCDHNKAASWPRDARSDVSAPVLINAPFDW